MIFISLPYVIPLNFTQERLAESRLNEYTTLLKQKLELVRDTYVNSVGSHVTYVGTRECEA